MRNVRWPSMFCWSRIFSTPYSFFRVFISIPGGILKIGSGRDLWKTGCVFMADASSSSKLRGFFWPTLTYMVPNSYLSEGTGVYTAGEWARYHVDCFELIVWKRIDPMPIGKGIYSSMWGVTFSRKVSLNQSEATDYTKFWPYAPSWMESIIQHPQLAPEAPLKRLRIHGSYLQNSAYLETNSVFRKILSLSIPDK